MQIQKAKIYSATNLVTGAKGSKLLAMTASEHSHSAYTLVKTHHTEATW